MNREQLLNIERSAERARRVITQPFELRAADDDSGLLLYTGHASVTEHEYEVYGGPPYGWLETMSAGSFKRTLRNKADVAFLVNHDGLTLARTKSGTMKLAEDDIGLAVEARLDPRQGPVNDLAIANERGDVDEMSFAFRVVKDDWFDDEGNKATWMDGTVRKISEVNLHKGDVSAVNYGANDAASGGFRDLDMALAELRSGRQLTPEQRDAVREFAATLDEPDTYTINLSGVVPSGAELGKQVVEAIKSHESGNGPGWRNGSMLTEVPESHLATMRYHWDLRLAEKRSRAGRATEQLEPVGASQSV